MALNKNGLGEYEVGYGKPPKHSQFQPGVSGNPKGRPKKKTAIDVDVHSVLDAPQKIRPKGKEIKISGSETVFRSSLSRALKQDKVRDLIRVIRSFEEHGCLTRPETEEAHGVLVVPYDMIDGDLIEAAKRLIAAAKVEGIGPKEMSRQHIARRDAVDIEPSIENEMGADDRGARRNSVHFIQKIADEHHLIDVDGKSMSVTTAELALRKLHQLALKGHAQAIKERERLMQLYDPTPDSDPRYGYVIVPETLPEELFIKRMEEKNARMIGPPALEYDQNKVTATETD